MEIIRAGVARPETNDELTGWNLPTNLYEECAFSITSSPMSRFVHYKPFFLQLVSGWKPITRQKRGFLFYLFPFFLVPVCSFCLKLESGGCPQNKSRACAWEEAEITLNIYFKHTIPLRFSNQCLPSPFITFFFWDGMTRICSADVFISGRRCYQGAKGRRQEKRSRSLLLDCVKAWSDEYALIESEMNLYSGGRAEAVSVLISLWEWL